MFLIAFFLRRGMPKPVSLPTDHSHQHQLPYEMEVYQDQEGRRWLDEVPYLLPKDAKEIERLSYQHYVLRHVLGGKHTYAPIEDLLSKNTSVLDVGCGTGHWCYDIAKAYPKAQVIGVDLEATARPAHAPLNYQFHQGNILHGLPFFDRTFDYTHQRFLIAAIPTTFWPQVIRELVRVTKDNGWIELVEASNSFHRRGPNMSLFLNWASAVSRERGIDASAITHLGQWLEEARLSHIQTKTLRLPLGKWGGRVGRLLAMDVYEACKAMKSLFLKTLSIEPTRFDALLDSLPEEWDRHQTQLDFFLAAGKRQQEKALSGR